MFSVMPCIHKLNRWEQSNYGLIDEFSPIRESMRSVQLCHVYTSRMEEICQLSTNYMRLYHYSYTAKGLNSRFFVMTNLDRDFSLCVEISIFKAGIL